MKTKITSFLKAAVLSVLALSTVSLAEEDNGFYEKDHIRGFISIGGDYRGMREEFQNYVNTVAFANGAHHYVAPGDSVAQDYSGKLRYSTFDDYYLGLHVNVGAQYKQFLTWFDFNFMPSQVSERPSNSYTATAESGDQAKFPLYDVKWYAYGADWMFGWKLFGEDCIINLIPSVGFGFNLINFHLASNFSVTEDGSDEYVTLRNRFYSTMATTVNSELELRVELGQLAIGLYGGYRFVRYNELDVEGVSLQSLKYTGDNTDNTGDTYFLGLRLTWIFKSDWQSKQENKL
ncbi:MAG: hypothetical protein MJZ26_07190 [Fibrobacter sp.]|nr:hypothetical protein [Fibrobacter sp.]